MLYYLFTWLREHYGFFGAGVWYYITFRAAMAIILSLVISMVFGKRLIAFLHHKQIGETVRDLGLAGEQQKRGTPTMGGLIIIGAILIPTLLFARIHNVYIVLMLVSTIWLGLVGFLDDYIKVFKKNKEGLAGRFKIAGQIGLGIIVGSVMYWNENVVTSREVTGGQPKLFNSTERIVSKLRPRRDEEGKTHIYVSVQSAVTTVPFTKTHELSFGKIGGVFGEAARRWL